MKNNYRPVLLVQGFKPELTNSGEFTQYSYTTPSDRGELKYIDMIFFEDKVTVFLNEPGNFTVAVGGQNVIETESFPNWDIQSQLGKNQFWEVRTYAQENQTIVKTLDLRLSTTSKFSQLITKYTTAAHEEFLKSYQLKFSPGIKRKGYQLTRIVGTVNTNFLEVQLPRQKGNIIGIGISNGGNVDDIDQINTLINVYIDGVKIIDKVCAGFFNISSGRESYLNKIFILPGATMKIELEVVNLGGFAPVPALQSVTHDFCIYFGN
jgi:hypothetical protein